jgi:hypothetical protein
MKRKEEIFFGGPLAKAFWGNCAIPNFHSVSDRCRESLPILGSFNAGQLLLFSCASQHISPAEKSQTRALLAPWLSLTQH